MISFNLVNWKYCEGFKCGGAGAVKSLSERLDGTGLGKSGYAELLRL